MYGNNASGGVISGGYDNTYNVSALGEMSGEDKGEITDYNAETGYFKVGNKFGWYDATNGIMLYSDGSSTNSLTADFHIAVKGATKVTASKAGSYWNAGKTKLITLTIVKEDVTSTVTVFVYNDRMYYNVSWTTTDGTTYTAAEAYKATELTIVGSDGKAIASFGKAPNGGLTLKDGTQGTFTCEGKEDLILNGAGIASGALSGIYTAADEGAGYTYDVTTTDGQYKVTISGSTYTVEDNRVTITFVNDLKAIAPVTPFYGKSVTLPSDDEVAVEGYKFRGWYENAEFTGSAETSVTLTADATYYAKYEAIVNITFDYSGYEYETGKTTKVVNTLAIGDTLGNTIPTVDATVVFEGKVFAGWFAKSGDDWGEQATSSTKVTAAVTYYAKWVEAHVLYGTYKGVEFDTSYLRPTVHTLTIDILGNSKFGSNDYGVATYDAETGKVVFSKNKRVAYYDAVSKTLRINYSEQYDAFSTDSYVLTNVQSTSTSVSAISSNVVRWDDSYQQLGIVKVDGNDQYYYLHRNGVYGNVTVSVVDSTGAAVTAIKNFATKGNVMTLTDVNGKEVAKFVYDGTTFIGSDGKSGTYTGEYGEIVVDGYGTLTIGGATAAYTVDGNNITFVAANAMRIVALGEGTYTKVEDAYKGTYTLPDNAGTITLDGFGGAGGGKTYVVSGTNITIFDGATSTTYGLDVANQALLGKSVFAGYTFSGEYYDEYGEGNYTVEFIFDDASSLTGVLKISFWSAAFTATFDGNTIVMTMTGDLSGALGWKGKVVTATFSGNTFTVTAWNGWRSSGGQDMYNFNGAKLTCAEYGA